MWSKKGIGDRPTDRPDRTDTATQKAKCETDATYAKSLLENRTDGRTDGRTRPDERAQTDGRTHARVRTHGQTDASGQTRKSPDVCGGAKAHTISDSVRPRRPDASDLVRPDGRVRLGRVRPYINLCRTTEIPTKLVWRITEIPI